MLGLKNGNWGKESQGFPFLRYPYFRRHGATLMELVPLLDSFTPIRNSGTFLLVVLSGDVALRHRKRSVPIF